jgi:hypothetical protein
MISSGMILEVRAGSLSRFPRMYWDGGAACSIVKVERAKVRSDTKMIVGSQQAVPGGSYCWLLGTLAS